MATNFYPPGGGATVAGITDTSWSRNGRNLILSSLRAPPNLLADKLAPWREMSLSPIPTVSGLPNDDLAYRLNQFRYLAKTHGNLLARNVRHILVVGLGPVLKSLLNNSTAPLIQLPTGHELTVKETDESRVRSNRFPLMKRQRRDGVKCAVVGSVRRTSKRSSLQ